MTILEVKARLTKEELSWWDIICAPQGIIETQEQYEYVMNYAKNTTIRVTDCKDLQSFDTTKGKYLGIGDYFGGGAFYFYLDERGKYRYQTNDFEQVPFTYGKYGKIEFGVN